MVLKAVSPGPAEHWYRSQEFISDHDKRICKLTNNDDKKDVKWMGFGIMFVQDDRDGSVEPTPTRFQIPANDFQDAVNKFDKAYADHVAKVNVDLKKAEEDKPKIVVPGKSKVIT